MTALKLKNGTEEVEPLVAATMMSLQHLWNSGLVGMTMVSDLVQICRRDPKYRKFGINEEKLQQLSLLNSDGTVHESVRNIVLSAFTGEGLSLKFDSPVA